MRKLSPSDAFKAARIIKKAKLKDTIQGFMQKGKTIDLEDEETVNELGIEVVFSIVDACATEGIEGDFYDFLSGPFEMKSEEIETMSLESLIANLRKLADENNLTLFFKLAGK